jgi:phage gpG-like protein
MRMTTLLQVKFNLPGWAEKFKASMNDLQGKALATLQTNRGMLFRNEGAYNGHEKWKPLKSRKGQILADTGTLKNSIAPKTANKDHPVAGPNGILKFSGDVMTIGSTVKYAAVHNYGAVIKPKTKDMLRWKDAKGWHVAKQVKIPARPFLDGAWNLEDQEELNTTMANMCARIFNGVNA